MKDNRRAILIITGLLLVCLMMSSCASKSAIHEDSIPSSSSMDGAAPSEVGFGEESASDDDISGGSIEPEKVITSVHLSLETTEFDTTIKDLNSIIGKNKGYVENSHISSTSRMNNRVFKHAEYTIRIPKDNINSFTGEMDSIGNVISQGTS